LELSSAIGSLKFFHKIVCFCWLAGGPNHSQHLTRYE